MNIYAIQGFNQFIIATGYKGEVIHNWVSKELKEKWEVIPFDTGAETMTGGRIKKCMQMVPGERVLATYGDGLGNVNVKKLIEFHEHKEKLATVTAVRPPARFGVVETANGLVTHFGEKNQADAGWINGGFFVLEPEVEGYITFDSDLFEAITLPELTELNQLAAYKHESFWQPMDTLRERNELAQMAKLKNPPWTRFEL
jgi:glucose-1-phosphate cytidylyltransferase